MKFVAACARVTLIASLTSLSSCFDLFEQCRSFSDRICLYNLDTGENYYLMDLRKSVDQGGGVIDGVVLKIGWNDKYVFAWRYSIFRGDPDGWMVVNKETGWVGGPYDAKDPRIAGSLSKIEIIKPAEAWERLGLF